MIKNNIQGVIYLQSPITMQFKRQECFMKRVPISAITIHCLHADINRSRDKSFSHAKNVKQ